jgi:DNA-binding CsgD family transcriptional regulator
MEHVGLLGILVNLIVATWVAIFAYQTHRTYDSSFLSPLFHYSALYALAVFIVLVSLYVNINLQRGLPQERFPLLQDLMFLAISLIEIVLTYFMLRINLGFKGRDFGKRVKTWMLAGLGFFILSYVLKTILSQGAVLRILNTFHATVFDNFVIVEIVVLIMILIPGKKVKDRNIIRLRRSFGWLFLSRYIIIGSLFLVFVVFISDADMIVPRAVRYPGALVIILLFSLVPFLWIKYFFRKYAESMLVIIEDREVLDAIFEKYGISKREQDILRLIVDSKSNKDIEEILFISYHTVKNHVYNLYQKLGVKNRFELVHLITKYQKE